jgi:SAM-dependent methyltransferase
MARDERDVREDLAHSLDAEPDLLPFIPYLLQDLWSLGFAPERLGDLMQRNLGHRSGLGMLDLGCGKGALLIHLARRFGWHGRGIDIVPEFIGEARRRADQHGVATSLRFDVGDMRDTLHGAVAADLIIFGYDCDALGALDVALGKLRPHLLSDGRVLLDTAWSLPGFQHSGLLNQPATLHAIAAAGFRVADMEITPVDVVREQNRTNTESIRRRAIELSQTHSQKRELIARYLADQVEECRVLEDEAACASLLLAG